jgi:hypothetical protein
MAKKENPYLSSIEKLPSKNTSKVFIVKHYDSQDNKTSQVGPFVNEQDAWDAVKAFLKKGTCSWVVKYGS